MANKALIVTVLCIYFVQLGVGTTPKKTEYKTFMVGSVNGRWNSSHLALQETTTTAENVNSVATGVMIAYVVIMWITLIVATVVSCFLESAKDRKVTLWWEYIVFMHLYFNIASFLVLYFPQGLQFAEGFAWIANGVLVTFISLVISVGLAAIYSKIVKVCYADSHDDTLWSVLRLSFIGFILVFGFGAGGLTIYTSFHMKAKTVERWLYAIGIVIAALIVVILPTVFTVACLLDTNSERHKDNKRKEKNKDRDRDRDRIRESVEHTRAQRLHYGSQVSEGSGHIRAILEAGQKTEHKPLTLTRSPSLQSTGSMFYERQKAKMPKGESISMYGQQPTSGHTSPAATAVPPPPPRSSPPALTSPTTSPSPPVEKRSSQQSTGSNYYMMLMQGNVPKVKSISQYGALLNQSPK